ncbi:MAG TPA: 3-hydroxy-3-methylglutaryl-CoA lyase [Clostridiales bacterium]|nr:3-hydroxy-3-methylglutaryl-CoA lyase [Clostridiales bacterium]
MEEGLAEGHIRILDCTLQDGGYCNQWRFGFENTRRIIRSLIDAGVDIIECGILSDRVTYRRDFTIFTGMEEAAQVIPEERCGRIFACRINYGEYGLEKLPEYDGTSLDAIRLAFHKVDMAGALKLCSGIKAKGYRVFVEPMAALDYSDEEFVELVRMSNRIAPDAFYIADSFGNMGRKDLVRLFSVAEHNLSVRIAIGYHAYHNMQLAYANAQALADFKSKRGIIIDSSIFGMGRGAGNLNTELLAGYLNENMGTRYLPKPLLTVMDEVVSRYYSSCSWGYSLPGYLSATHNCHPEYAYYLEDKNTLTLEDMDEILGLMREDKRHNYDQQYMEGLYLAYMKQGEACEENLSELKHYLRGKQVLMIAPGMSAEKEREKVATAAARRDVVSISVNFDYPYYNTDFIFLSNLRRYRYWNPGLKGKTIVTSNIPAEGVYLKAKYGELLNNIEGVKDNAGMMLLKYLVRLDVCDILLAGFDGYSYDISQNYAVQELAVHARRAAFDKVNTGMSRVLSEYAKHIRLEFVTEPKHVQITRMTFTAT